MQKPTLMQLREQHRITILKTAQISGLKPIIVWRAFLNVGVSHTHAERIVTALNALTGQRYTLNDIEMKVQP